MKLIESDSAMKGKITLLLLVILFIFNSESKAQHIELLGGNVLNGAVTGSILGAATMGLQNSDDFTPLRVGLGAGTIAGAGVAIYDIVTLPRGQQFYISGVFNDGTNTSIIILLDTFYGAAAGAILGSAGMLIADEPILDGLQYGASIGAWVGFGFGLMDALIIARRNRDFIGSSLLNRRSLIETRYENATIGFGQPGLISHAEFSNGSITTSHQPVMGVVSLRVGL
jgi:hypothetical protein